jgi:hypothetical protein
MSTAPKPFAFVLMPFSPEFDDVYELAIQPACELAGAYAERVDKQIFVGSILERVYNQISKADLIVADMSDRNPNVFYEVGYAHALGKPTILLTKSADDIPFDLKHYPHIVYNDRLVELKPALEARVRWLIENPPKAEKFDADLLVRVNGIPLDREPVVPTTVPGSVIGFNLKVEVQNRIDRVIGTTAFQVGLIAPSEFVRASAKESGENTEVDLDSNQRLFLNQAQFVVLPGAWETITFSPCTYNRAIKDGEEHRFTLKIYRESGVQDHPFVVHTRVTQ